MSAKLPANRIAITNNLHFRNSTLTLFLRNSGVKISVRRVSGETVPSDFERTHFSKSANSIYGCPQMLVDVFLNLYFLHVLWLP